MQYTGTAHVFGRDVNTDEIVPARYLTTSEAKLLASYCMEDARPGFAKTVARGDIIVAGGNFGCGSSREHAPIAIKAAGVSCVIAESFARIFFRNAINIGMPIIECPGIAAKVKEGDRLTVDLTAGAVILPSGERLAVPPFPPFMEGIVREGGWMPYLLKHHAGR
ncbi:MAG: 3-isopropylmalate dehydratase small subunit [Spirochaetes bacterium RBG_13_68_11]|nr:MAG: 3-isopropylmalate dehydratase small subunit [Spirochaetes bacterium RBG_13_68_11]